MSIMTDARLRLLEARVAEIERRLAERAAPVPAAGAAPAAAPKTGTKNKSARKPSKRGRTVR